MIKRKTNRIVRAIALGMALWLSVACVLPLPAVAKQEQAAAALKRGVDFLAGMQREAGPANSTDWTILSLASNRDLPGGITGSELRSWLEARKTEFDRKSLSAPTTDYARLALAVSAAGGDPGDFGGSNLKKILRLSQTRSGKFADRTDGSGQELINAHVWAIIALSACGDSPPRPEAARRWLINRQNRDGGFGFQASLSVSDVDMTAHSLIALACLKEPRRSPAVRKALSYLQKNQGEDGGFRGWGGDNCETNAAVLQALIACGENPAARPWVQKRGNPVTALLSYQLADGSFCHHKAGKPNIMAAEQAVSALSGLLRGETIYQELQRKKGLLIPKTG